jgi:hypothetical protein
MTPDAGRLTHSFRSTRRRALAASTTPPGRKKRSNVASSGPEFVRGALAAFTNILVTFPVHKVMFRQQVEGKSALRSARGVAAEGLSNLYRGVGPPLAQKSLSMAAMFGLYDVYYKAILRRLEPEDDDDSTAHLSYGATLMAQAVAATLAGSTEALLAPLERAQSLLQHRRFNGHFSNTWDVFQKLYPYGIREYYRGITPILMRNGPSSAMFFCLRGPVTDLLPRSKSREFAVVITECRVAARIRVGFQAATLAEFAYSSTRHCRWLAVLRVCYLNHLTARSLSLCARACVFA